MHVKIIIVKSFIFTVVIAIMLAINIMFVIVLPAIKHLSGKIRGAYWNKNFTQLQEI